MFPFSLSFSFVVLSPSPSQQDPLKGFNSITDAGVEKSAWQLFNAYAITLSRFEGNLAKSPVPLSRFISESTGFSPFSFLPSPFSFLLSPFSFLLSPLSSLLSSFNLLHHLFISSLILALFSSIAAGPYEMSLGMGDLLRIEERGGEWFKGEKLNSGFFFLFFFVYPFSFVLYLLRSPRRERYFSWSLCPMSLFSPFSPTKSVQNRGKKRRGGSYLFFFIFH